MRLSTPDRPKIKSFVSMLDVGGGKTIRRTIALVVYRGEDLVYRGNQRLFEPIAVVGVGPSLSARQAGRIARQICESPASIPSRPGVFDCSRVELSAALGAAWNGEGVAS